MGGKPRDKFYSIRIPETIKQQAKEDAKKMGVSFNEHIVNAITLYIEIPEEVYALAQESGRPLNELIQEALKEFLRQQPRE